MNFVPKSSGLPEEGLSARAEKRELRIRRIMKAATTCFVQSGFQGASMQQICREADMSPGALYRYFPSKEAIIEAIGAEIRQRDAELLSEMSHCDDVVEGILRAFFNHLLAVERAGLQPLFIELRAEAMRNEAVRAACQTSEDQVLKSFRSYLERAIEDGRIDPVVPVDSLIALLMAVGEGLIMADLSERLPRSHIETSLRATISAAVRPRGDDSASAACRH